MQKKNNRWVDGVKVKANDVVEKNNSGERGYTGRMGLTLSLCGLLLAAGMAHAAEPARQELRVCMEGNNGEFSYMAPTGELKGFDPDIAAVLVKQIGRTMKIVRMDWDGIIPALLAKKCDAIIASMAINEERKKKVDFTDKYYAGLPRQFIGRKSSHMAGDHQSMKGKSVGVPRATIDQEYMARAYPEVKLRLYATQDEMSADLLAGRIDALLGDVLLNTRLLETPGGSKLTVFGPKHIDPIFGRGAAIAVRKGDDNLRLAFNKAIKQIRASGEYQKINNKYFPIDMYDDSIFKDKYKDDVFKQ